MKAAVLGCGPAGLIAAHALHAEGADSVRIFSKIHRKSEMYGAQYLHAPIDGVTHKPPVTVDYRLSGSVTGYREKVYGPRWSGAVSAGDLEGTHLGWDIRDTYNELWSLYGAEVETYEITPTSLAHLAVQFDMVVSTVPAKALCSEPQHRWLAQTVWAAGDAPERGVMIPSPLRPARNTVLCSGRPEDGWYRASNVFGQVTVEWPLHGRNNIAPMESAVVVTKPLSTDCDCFPAVVRAGRYGTWTKGVLSHEVWTTVREAYGALYHV